MKSIEIPSQKYLLECFSYNKITGNLYWNTRPASHFKSINACNSFNIRFANKEAGCIKNHGYKSVCINLKDYLVHRIIFKIIYNKSPVCIDHINGNRIDNKITNIRSANKSQNGQNQNLHKDNKLQIKGVYFCNTHKKYKSQIKINKKVVSLGYFLTANDAHKAYCDASLKYYGEFSNFGHITDSDLHNSNTHLCAKLA